jgi:HEAT repeat protein
MNRDDDDDAGGPDLPDLAADEIWDLPPESRGVLVESLASDDPTVRLDAIEMLSHSLDDELALRALALARDDPDEEVRVAAVLALGPGLGASEAEADEESGVTAAAPLSPSTVATIGQGLKQLYYDSAAPKIVRRRALETAVYAPGEWQDGATRAAWASGDAEWKQSAIFAMARLSGFERELVEALRDRSPLVRLESARAVGDSGIREAATRLLALARAADEEHLVRMAAMESLGLLGDRHALVALREIAAGTDSELAYAARSAMARITRGDEGDDDVPDF